MTRRSLLNWSHFSSWPRPRLTPNLRRTRLHSVLFLRIQYLFILVVGTFTGENARERMPSICSTAVVNFTFDMVSNATGATVILTSSVRSLNSLRNEDVYSHGAKCGFAAVPMALVQFSIILSKSIFNLVDENVLGELEPWALSTFGARLASGAAARDLMILRL